MTLLREIQEAATDSKVDISTVLRKAKTLAFRLQNREFENWVDRELNGYDAGANLPPYRKIPVVARAHLKSWNLHWNDAPIMTSFLPASLRDWGQWNYCGESISTIASMAGDGSEGMFQAPWPQELAVKYGAKGYNNFECLGAWQVINRSSLLGIVEQVRNRVLEFALRIEVAVPGAGETQGDSTLSIPQETVAQIFYTNVYGDANNIAAGGSQIRQQTDSGVRAGDMGSLLRYLREIGIPNDQISALRQSTEKHPDKKAAAEGWLGKLAVSTATGAANAGVGLAATAIAHYFGLSAP
ncbi:MAG: hypothetical protein ACLQKA_22775 [Bryobacteraceae bacterium]